VVVGDNCIVGHGTELKNVILFPEARAAHFSYLGDSILGHHVNLGAGVKCANVRLDGQVISVRIEGKKICTGRKKLGAIIGNRVQLGCNAVTNPGTLISPDTLCPPLSCLKGWVTAS
jgi:NDP-sugar pyrophosphorylase family protein